MHDALKERARGASEGARYARVRAVLAISEIAVACVLLVAAGLLTRSVLRVLDVDLGFLPQRVAALRIDPGARYADRAATCTSTKYHRVRTLPGVDAAGITDILPLSGNRSGAWQGRAGTDHETGVRSSQATVACTMDSCCVESPRWCRPPPGPRKGLNPLA